MLLLLSSFHTSLNWDLGPKTPNTMPLPLPACFSEARIPGSFMMHLVNQQMSAEYLMCAEPYDTPWGYRGEPGMVLDLIGFFTNDSLLLKTFFFFFALGFHETTLSMFPPISLPVHSLLHFVLYLNSQL